MGGIRRPHYRVALLSLLGAVLASSGVAATPSNKARPSEVETANAPSFQAGFVVLVYGNGGDFAGNSTQLLDRLIELHVNSVSLVFPVFQTNWTASEVYADSDSTPSQDNMAVFVQQAHARGLTVMLRPTLDEASLMPDDKWRGTIEPKSVAAWFKSYGALMVQYAQFAEREGVEIFTIGSEFESLEKYGKAWARIVDQVNEVYSGDVSYALNWHTATSVTVNNDAVRLRSEPSKGASVVTELPRTTELRLVGQSKKQDDVVWWPVEEPNTGTRGYVSETYLDGPMSLIRKLDFVGVDAFFPLDAPDGASVAELGAAWKPWMSVIQQLRASSGKDVVLTEVGTRAQAGSYREPWVWSDDTPVNARDQASFFSSVCDHPRRQVTGMYVWMADLNKGVAATAASDLFSPLNRRAESVIRACYGDAAAAGSVSA